MAADVFAPCEEAEPLTDRSMLFICHDESDAAARVTRKALVQHRTIRAAAPPSHCSLVAPTSTDVAVVAVEAQSALGVRVAGTVTPAHLCRGSDAGSTSSSLDESGSGGGSSDGLPPPKRRRAAVTAHGAAADGARRGNWVPDWIPSEQGRASGVRPAGAASWQGGGKGPVWEAEERERRGYAQQERAQSQALRHLLHPPCTLLAPSSPPPCSSLYAHSARSLHPALHPRCRRCGLRPRRARGGRAPPPPQPHSPPPPPPPPPPVRTASPLAPAPGGEAEVAARAAQWPLLARSLGRLRCS